MEVLFYMKNLVLEIPKEFTPIVINPFCKELSSPWDGFPNLGVADYVSSSWLLLLEVVNLADLDSGKVDFF